MSDKQIVVRDIVDSDLESVREVLLDAYEQYAISLPPESWEEYRTSIVSSVTEANSKAKLVAVVDGKVVGSVFIFDSSITAYGNEELDIATPIIRLLAVSKQARHLGVATELIRASAKRALEWGADTLHLHTSDMMDSAVRLYERLGFERAYDKEFYKGNILVKSYRLLLKDTVLLEA